MGGVQLYKEMQERHKLGNYHLLLAHDIIARPSEYEAVFSKKNPYWRLQRTIILDNSVVELKDPMVDVKLIAEAARIVDANVIVLPDVYKKGPETMASIEAAVKPWAEYLDPILNKSYSFMVVPQGRTLEEFAKCAEYLSDIRGITIPNAGWWGIPRNMVEMTGYWAQFHPNPARPEYADEWVPGSRRLPLLMCARLAPHRAIHMLGFSDSIIDDWDCVRNAGQFVRGIDSAVPLRAGSAGIGMSWDLRHLGPREEGWLENAEYSDLMQRNIDYAQWMFSGSEA